MRDGKSEEEDEKTCVRSTRLMRSNRLTYRVRDLRCDARHLRGAGRNRDGNQCANAESRCGSTSMSAVRTCVRESERLLIRWRETSCCRG